MLQFFKGLVVGVVGGGLLGFMLGVYLLPILIAEDGASKDTIMMAVEQAERKGTFRRDLVGSDLVHWGEGEISLSKTAGSSYLTLMGSVSPGPDYRLYLAPRFVETEAEFLAIKASSVQVSRVKAFTNFHIKVPDHINTDAYPAVIIWCEAFEQFITAATLN